MSADPISDQGVGDYRVWVNPCPPSMCSALIALSSEAVHIMRRLGVPIPEPDRDALLSLLSDGFSVSLASIKRVAVHPWLARLDLHFDRGQLAWQATDEQQRDSFYAALKSALGEQFREERAPESKRRIVVSTLIWLVLIALPTYALLLAAESPDAARGTGRHLRRNLVVGCAQAVGTTGISVIAAIIVAMVLMATATRWMSRRELLSLIRRDSIGKT